MNVQESYSRALEQGTLFTDRPEQPLLLVDGVLLSDERVHVPEVVGAAQVCATGFEPDKYGICKFISLKVQG